MRGRQRRERIEAGGSAEAPAAIRHAAEHQLFTDRLYQGHDPAPLLADLQARFQEPLDDELLELARRTAEGCALSLIRKVLE